MSNAIAIAVGSRAASPENDGFCVEGEPPPSPTTSDMNRVHEELEKLNIATDVINKLELQLDEARAKFREVQTGWTQRLDQLSKKLGTCIDKSRPYYEARMQLHEAQQKAQRAALRFERANSMHAVAKQQVSLTQDSLNRASREVNPACLEVLNHHIQRVNEAEMELLQSEDEHRRVSRQVEDANRLVLSMEKELKRSIQRSKPYFESRIEFTKKLEQLKDTIQRLEADVKQKKQDYNTSLRNLERISEQIHERRQTLGKRDPGVGCETPDPPPAFRHESEDQQPPAQPLKVLRRRSKTSHKVEDIMAILGAQIATEEKQQSGNRPRSESAPTPSESSVTDAQKRLNSGVILLAQQLMSPAGIKTIVTIDDAERKSREFSFPPDQLDMEYKTVPAGVKPFPTPPDTPDPTGTPPICQVHREISDGADSAARDAHLKVTVTGGKESELNSETSSLSSFALDDESIERAMRSPDGLIREIDRRLETAMLSSSEEEPTVGASLHMTAKAQA